MYILVLIRVGEPIIYIKGINLMIENEKDVSVNEGLTDIEREQQAEFQLELLAELGLIIKMALLQSMMVAQSFLKTHMLTQEKRLMPL